MNNKRPLPKPDKRFKRTMSSSTKSLEERYKEGGAFDENLKLWKQEISKSEEPNQFLYSYSFAELCDRASIVLMKIANSTDPTAFNEELKDILHDIQLHINETPVNAEMVKGIIVLTQVNSFIWGNEQAVRSAGDNNDMGDTELLAMLKESHKANSLRGEAKKHIQLQRNSRTDEKLNYGLSTGFWNIKW